MKKFLALYFGGLGLFVASWYIVWHNGGGWLFVIPFILLITGNATAWYSIGVKNSAVNFTGIIKDIKGAFKKW